MSVYIPEGFLLHPFQLWICKAKLTTNWPKNSRNFFTHFFFLERSLQLFFAVLLQRGSPFCIKHHQRPYGLKGSLPSASVLQFQSPDWSCHQLWWKEAFVDLQNDHGIWFMKLPLTQPPGWNSAERAELLLWRNFVLLIKWESTLVEESCMPVIKLYFQSQKCL